MVRTITSGFTVLFAFQVILNVVVVLQQRAAATASFIPSFSANVLLAALTYCCVRRLVLSSSMTEGVGYALGGGLGGVLGITLARMLGV